MTKRDFVAAVLTGAGVLAASVGAAMIALPFGLLVLGALLLIVGVLTGMG